MHPQFAYVINLLERNISRLDGNVSDVSTGYAYGKKNVSKECINAEREVNRQRIKECEEAIIKLLEKGM